MLQETILQTVQGGDLEVDASAANYAALMLQWGLPATHTQLLRELKNWISTVPTLRRQPQAALQHLLEIEGAILMDASISGIAAAHIPFLYTVLGEVFEELGPQFRKELRREAAQAEQELEESLQTQMDDTGVDRLEAVYDMENEALARLQERQERVMLLVEGLAEEDAKLLSP